MWPSSLSLTGGAGGAAGASDGTANNGLSIPLSNPFNFDASGWIVNLGTTGTTSTAAGNTGANPTRQTASATPSGASGSLGTVGGGNMLPLLLGAVGLFLVLSHKL